MSNLTLAGVVILTGIVIVFLALVLLIFAVKLMGVVVAKIAQPKAKSTPPAPPVAKAAAPSAPAPAPVATPSAADNGEVIAVISAAVGAYMEQSAPGVPYAVTGISPATGRDKSTRPVWGFAGMRQNTEPF